MTEEQKRQALLSLKKANNGRLTATMVVDAAKAPEHLFHELFIWDDARAAQKYRLDVARSLIASVQINLIVGRSHVKTICFARDPNLPHNVQGYIEIDSARRSRNDSMLIADAELARAEASLQRAKEVINAVVPQLSDQVGALILQLTNLRGQLQHRKKAA